MSKYKKLKEIINSLELEDIPQGETLLYIGTKYLNLISNTDNLEEIMFSAHHIMQVAAELITRVVSEVEGPNVVETAESFISVFRSLLLEELSKDNDLFIRFLDESSDHMNNDEKERKSEVMFIQVEGYN